MSDYKTPSTRLDKKNRQGHGFIKRFGSRPMNPVKCFLFMLSGMADDFWASLHLKEDLKINPPQSTVLLKNTPPVYYYIVKLSSHFEFKMRYHLFPLGASYRVYEVTCDQVQVIGLNDSWITL